MKPIIIDKLSFFGLESDPIIEWVYVAFYEEELPVEEQNNSIYAPNNWHEVKPKAVKTISIYDRAKWLNETRLETVQ